MHFLGFNNLKRIMGRGIKPVTSPILLIKLHLLRDTLDRRVILETDMYLATSSRPDICRARNSCPRRALDGSASPNKPSKSLKTNVYRIEPAPDSCRRPPEIRNEANPIFGQFVVGQDGILRGVGNPAVASCLYMTRDSTPISGPYWPLAPGPRFASV
jgi:hypothetical protein